MTGFVIVWLGQIVSVLATFMTQFALTIWVFEKTGSATALGLLQVFFITPFLLVSPLAGVMVDRYNRKLMMMVSDLTAGLATVSILVLQWMGVLEIWHLYAAAIFHGLGNSFQWPAYSAAIATMLPKEQYGRANGMMTLIEAGPAVFSPLFAGALLPLIGFTGILSIDVVTFVLAVLALLVVHIPQPERTQEGQKSEGGFLKEAAYGFRYIFERPGLLGLQTIFFFGNLFSGIAMTVTAPMILLRTNNDASAFGWVQSIGAVGGIIGGLLMSAWGGPKRKVNGILLGWITTSIIGMVIFPLGRFTTFWAVSLFFTFLVHPILNGSSQAIWQAKVAQDLQGRVFSARRLIAWLASPIAPLIAGTLGDYVMEPQMQISSSGLSQVFGGLFGSEPGAGMALLIFICGIFGVLIGLTGFFLPFIYHVESNLPDHDELAKADAVAA
jgi:MFS family permease